MKKVMRVKWEFFFNIESFYWLAVVAVVAVVVGSGGGAVVVVSGFPLFITTP